MQLRPLDRVALLHQVVSNSEAGTRLVREAMVAMGTELEARLAAGPAPSPAVQVYHQGTLMSADRSASQLPELASGVPKSDELEQAFRLRSLAHGLLCGSG